MTNLLLLGFLPSFKDGVNEAKDEINKAKDELDKPVDPSKN